MKLRSLLTWLMLSLSGLGLTTALADDLFNDAYIKATNTTFFTKFGQAVAIAGDTMVIGSPYEKCGSTGVNGDQSNTNGDQSGAVYVYIRSGTEWVFQAYLKASNTEAKDHFGTSVAISGNTIVVGAPDEDSGAQTVNGSQTDNSQSSTGAAYVFVRTGTSWAQQAYLKGSKSDGADYFGQTIAIDGNTIAVGAYNESGARGAAYVFTRSGATWTEEARLTASNADTNDWFGYSVAVAGNTLLVGAPHEESRASDPADNSGNNVGAVYIFGRTGKVWTQQRVLKSSTVFNDNDDLFGSSVAISGDTIVVGAPGEESNATGVNGNEFDNSLSRCGAAYVFVRGDGSWPRKAYLKGRYPANLNEFGSSVAISADRVVVGCHGDDLGIPNTTEIGAAYQYERIDGYWSMVGRLVPHSNSYSELYNDEMGTSVAIAGDVVVVGAPGENGSSTGTHGDPSLSGELDAGAAYVFHVGAVVEGIAKTGVTAPGAPSIAYGKVGTVTVDSSSLGGLLFQASVTGPGAPAGQTQAMFSLDRFSSLTWMSMRTGTAVGGMLGLPAGSKVSALSMPVNTAFSDANWYLGTVSTSKVVFLDDGKTVTPVFRTGLPVAALSNLRLASIREMVPSFTQDQVALGYTLSGATTASDTGVLVVDKKGVVINSALREGASYFGMGTATFGQFGRSSQVHSGLRFIVKMIPGPGQTSKDTIVSPSQAYTPAQGDLAGGTSAGERYGTFLGLGRASIYGLLRATLTNSPITTNEGLWLDSGALATRKGDDLGNGLKIAKFIRVWGNDAPEYVMHVVLTGTGVTSANNVALVTRPHNGAYQIVARTGSPVPGIPDPKVTLKSFSAVDAAPGNGFFILLATLNGAPSTSNQVLLAGRATPTDNPIPHLVLRKGDPLHTALTPSSVIKSIAVTPFSDPGGVGGGTRPMAVNAGIAAALVTLSSGAQELIRIDLSFL